MARTQRGFSMLEILVTLFLLTMWLLASAGVQSSALKFNKAAQFRTQAVYLATDLAERMQANKTATVAGGYVYSGAAITPPNCLTAACTSAQLAQFDLAEWNGRVTAALPNATVAVTGAVANPITYTIVISWSDRRTDRTYSTSGTSESFSYTATKTILN
jgi:type IV pilus assembly protein PilV